LLNFFAISSDSLLVHSDLSFKERDLLDFLVVSKVNGVSLVSPGFQLLDLSDQLIVLVVGLVVCSFKDLLFSDDFSDKSMDSIVVRLFIAC